MGNKIILNDSCCLTDLIIFEENINLKEINKIIENVQDTIEDYTNEDIYMAIEEKFKVKEIIDLSSIVEFYY